MGDPSIFHLFLCSGLFDGFFSIHIVFPLDSFPNNYDTRIHVIDKWWGKVHLVWQN